MAGWKSVEEVKAYTLSCRLRDEIFRLTETGPASRDFDYRDQIRRSSSSAPANLCEGFNLYFHGQFGYHASVAKGSLAETVTHLEDARGHKYFSPEDRRHLLDLAIEARRTTSGLLRYLSKSEAPTNPTRLKRPRRPRRQ